MTNQNTPGLDAEREAFLAWDKEIYALPERDYHEYKGGFGNLAVEGRWKAWQARSQLATTAQAEPVEISDEQIDAIWEKALESVSESFHLEPHEFNTDCAKNSSIRRGFARHVLSEVQPASAPVVGGDAVTEAEKAWRNHMDQANRENWNAVTFDVKHMNKVIGELDRLRAVSKAKPADVPAGAVRKYISPVNTVADLVSNLMLIDQSLPIYGAQTIEHPVGHRRTITLPPTVSLERVKDSRWIGEGDTLNTAIIWTKAEQPASALSGVTDAEGLTNDAVIDLVKESGLDWHAGFSLDDENRYGTLVRLAFNLGAASRALLGALLSIPEPDFYLDGGDTPCFYASTVNTFVAATQSGVKGGA